MNMLHILILGLDTFARKNVQQIVALGARGCRFDILTNDQRGDSQAILAAIPDHRAALFVSRGTIVGRLKLAWSLLSEGRYDLVELYPAGRMALFYLLMLKLKRQPFIVVERGDIGILQEHGRLTRYVIRAAYRLSRGIIYKETYMRDALRSSTSAPLFFVPNCIAKRQPGPTDSDPRPIDFLWVNRIVPQRRPAWVMSAMRMPPLQSKRLVLLGIEARANLPEHLRIGQEAVVGDRPPNVELHDFTDPMPYYDQARFFCLPATVVFGNNALLEAMSRGVVPIVTEAPGVELMVKDGLNGIVTPFNESAYASGLARAAALTPKQWARMSAAAVLHVRAHYSVEKWAGEMMNAYRLSAVTGSTAGM